MSEILLATLNARYVHAALGLRYLLANLGDLQDRARIREFVIGQRSEDIAEQILRERPAILGLGVYIWNVQETTRLVGLLKRVAPELKIVLGGPEVSYEHDAQPIVALADHVITGWGDLSFAKLVRQLLAGESAPKITAGEQSPLAAIAMPYALYSDEDLHKRHIYVEASRGCPFKCEFCLSALDATAWPFPLDAFMGELATLYQRGARHFKFVDRTFNLKIDTSLRILEFFLECLRQAPDDPVFVHFELIPDHLPERLKVVIAEFPPGTLQFEIGIQSFDPEVQQRISRRQKNEVALANLEWLRTQSAAHLHVDLIAGLPGETLEGFARGFDRLVALEPHEIQVGILKRLRGAPIDRHTDAHTMRYLPEAPYNVLSTDVLDFATLQRIQRFAKLHDSIANSGRFKRSIKLLFGDSPFAEFMRFADWLQAEAGQVHSLAYDRLVRFVYQYLTGPRGLDPASTGEALGLDFLGAGGRGHFDFVDLDALQGRMRREQRATKATPARQARHLRG